MHRKISKRRPRHLALLTLAIVAAVTATMSFVSSSQVSASANYSAGFVTPFTIQNGEYAYLLTQEVGGPDKGKWDALGGRREKGEHDPLVTAAREADEESMRLLSKYMNPDYIKNHSTKQKNESRKPTSYVTYVPPNDLTAFAKNFQKNRAALKRKRAPREILEKSAAGWISDKDLRSAIDENNGQATVSIVGKDGSTRKATVRLRKHTIRILKGKLPAAGERKRFVVEPKDDPIVRPNGRVKAHQLNPVAAVSEKPVANQPTSKPSASKEPAGGNPANDRRSAVRIEGKPAKVNSRPESSKAFIERYAGGTLSIVDSNITMRIPVLANAFAVYQRGEVIYYVVNDGIYAVSASVLGIGNH